MEEFRREVQSRLGEQERAKAAWMADASNETLEAAFRDADASLSKAVDRLNAVGLSSATVDKARALLEQQADVRADAKAGVVKSAEVDREHTLRWQLENNESLERMRSGASKSAAFEVKTLTTAPAVAGASTAPGHENLGGLIAPNRLGIKDQTPRQRFAITDLLMEVPTTSPIIEYTRWISSDAGASAAEVAEGAAKPKTGGFQYQLVTDRTRTIAVLLDASVQVLQDIPQLEAMIKQKLTTKLRARLNGQAIAGDGLGENLLGLANAAGTQVYTPGGGESALISVLKMIDLVEHGSSATEDEDFVTANGVIMHPSMSLSPAFKLAQDTTNRFIFLDPRQSPTAFGPWGLPEVTTKKVPTSRLWVGAFDQAALYTQQGVTIKLSEHNNDNFEKNIVTIRAEFRVGLGFWQPGAFVRSA